MKFGVAVSSLGPSQLSYHLIKNGNFLLSNNPTSDLVCFCEQLEKHCMPANFACMDMSEIWGYKFPVIGTSLSTVAKLLQCPSPSQIIFYVWDLEWIRLKQKNFQDLAAIYRHPSLKIVTRSQEHSDIFSKCWNRSVDHVNPDFNLERFEQCLNQVC